VIYPFDRQKLERVCGTPLPDTVVDLFGQLREKAVRAGGQSQPDPWVYALFAVLAEALHPDEEDSPVPVSDPEPENLLVRFQVGDDQADVREGRFVRLTDKGNYVVRMEGENKLRTVRKTKVVLNG